MDIKVELTPGMLLLIPVVAALVQVLKDKILAIKYIPTGISDAIKSVLPYVSIAIAFGLLCYAGVEKPLLESIMIGLSASGGYSAVKGATKKIQDTPSILVNKL